MDNDFIQQQKRRLEGNRRMLDESLQMFRNTIGSRRSGRKEKSGAGVFPSSMKVEPVKLPDRRIGFRELMRVMIHQISFADVLYVAAIALCMTLLGMLLPYVTRQLYDEMIPSNDRSMLIPLGILLLSASVGSAFFAVARALLLHRIRDKMNCALQSSLIERLFRLPVRFFRDFTAGKLGGWLMEINRMAYELTYKILGALISLVFATVYFLQINDIAPDLLGLSILSTVIQLILMCLFFIFASREQLRVRNAWTDMTGMLFDVIKGIPKIKSSAAEDRVFCHWAELYRDTLVDRADRNPLLVLYPALIALVTLGTTILTFKYSALHQLKVSDYAAYISAYGMVSAAITAISTLLPELTSVRSTIALCKPLLDTVPEGRKDYDRVTKLSGNITVSNLSFRYPGQTRPVFDNLSFQVQPGEYLGIAGPSGCGKSTLIRLLLGFEMPESGSIFFDHHSIDNVDIQSLRRRMGTVLQNGRIFQGTIHSNLTVINPSATLDEVWEALRLACLKEDIEALPMGLHTYLGEGGGGLSGGQRQRLLLARTLVAKPDIIILDEATSALDNITQAEVIRNLDSLNCTRICIAHRLSTVRNCSRIMVLSEGRIVEEGTFDSLMKQRGFFYELAKRQL